MTQPDVAVPPATQPDDPTDAPISVQIAKMAGLIVVLFGFIVVVMNLFVGSGRPPID